MTIHVLHVSPSRQPSSHAIFILIVFIAPSGVDFSPDALPIVGDYSGPLPNGMDVPTMTGLQIAMSREIFGWPLYAIVIGAGQVCSRQLDKFVC